MVKDVVVDFFYMFKLFNFLITSFFVYSMPFRDIDGAKYNLFKSNAADDWDLFRTRALLKIEPRGPTYQISDAITPIPIFLKSMQYNKLSLLYLASIDFSPWRISGRA